MRSGGGETGDSARAPGGVGTVVARTDVTQLVSSREIGVSTRIAGTPLPFLFRYHIPH